MTHNLPPGVSPGNLPGNTPEDAAWEALHEHIDRMARESGLTSDDARIAWQLGLSALREACLAGAWFGRPMPIPGVATKRLLGSLSLEGVQRAIDTLPPKVGKILRQQIENASLEMTWLKVIR